MTLLADLPPEILAQIFSYLPAAHIGQCSLTSRLFYTNSIELQYIIHLHLAHLESNPSSRALTYGDKLGAIKAREHAWTYLNPNFSKRTEVPFEPGSVYDLSRDVYILGDSSWTKIHCLKLPSAEDDPVEWRALASREGRQIVDFAINVYEHDLIVLVTAPQFFQPQHVSAPIELSLNKFSTNKRTTPSRKATHHLTRSSRVERNLIQNVEREAKDRKRKEEEEERQRQKRVGEEGEEDDFESWIRKHFSSGDWGDINRNPSGASTAASTSSSANGMTHASSSTQTPVYITTPNAALDASVSHETEFPPLASSLPNPLPLPQRHPTTL
ncbi:hypothetical protein VKT23_019298 [Stygiomarasmius scandens]|uniref:F-box domain-containing protein n=1 Tax=Marasmiellus scandens TaxID=2682957 RepID=A0ABR1IN91_9AGAR